MSNVIILGANGRLARNTTRFLLEHTDAHLTLYLRRASCLRNPDPARVTIIEGDVLDQGKLAVAMAAQDIVYARLAGQTARQARVIIDAMRTCGLKRLIFISSTGIQAPGSSGIRRWKPGAAWASPAPERPRAGSAPKQRLKHMANRAINELYS